MSVTKLHPDIQELSEIETEVKIYTKVKFIWFADQLDLIASDFRNNFGPQALRSQCCTKRSR